MEQWHQSFKGSNNIQIMSYNHHSRVLHRCQLKEETAQKSDGGFNQTNTINMDIMKITAVKVEVTEGN